MARFYSLLFVLLISVLHLHRCASKPTDVAQLPDTLDPLSPVHVDASASAKDVNREQRSPDFGLLGGDYHDYSDYDDDPRSYRLGHKRKFHKGHHKPHGHHGCRGYECGGYPSHGGYIDGHHPTGQGASFASASAGSVGGGGGPYGGHSQANAHAQSASFSIGPYTASFSVAQSSSLRKPF